MTRLATIALVATCLAVLPPSAIAAPSILDGSDYVVEPAQTITFSEMTINSCHSDVAGVNVQGDGVTMVSLGNNTGGECSIVTLDPASFTNDTQATQTFRLWLQDNSCSNIFFADGDHARVSRQRAAINDGGDGCVSGGTPKGKKANFRVSVSIS